MPTATDVAIIGDPIIGSTLTGIYTYNYSKPDPEGASTYQWYRYKAPEDVLPPLPQVYGDIQTQ
jgi:hypothetical protein